MIESLFLEYGGWSWTVLGLVLLIVEIVATSTFFLWFGVAALIVGLLTFALDGSAIWSLQAQLIAFVVLSVVAVVMGRKFVTRRDSPEHDPTLLNRRAKQLIGREAVLVEPIAQGVGRIKIGDSIWRVKGSDTPDGAKVVVVGEEDGTVLLVEAR